jgi:antitoxin HicB
MIKYQARIHADDGRFWAEFPDLPGCFAQGPTRSACLAAAREALSLFLEEARDPKWEVPTPRLRRGRVYVWVRPEESVAVPLMIRQARLRLGMTQRQLAERIGITVQQLQKLETPRKSNPTVRMLSEISRALNGELEISLVA